MKNLITLFTLLFVSAACFAQADTTKLDTTKKEIIIKDDWSKKKKTKSSKEKQEIIIKKAPKTNSKYQHTTTIGVGKTGLKIKERQDSTIIGIGGKELIISETNGNSKVRFRSRRRKRRAFNGHWTGIELGVNAFTKEDYSMYADPTNEFMELDLNKSGAFNINFLQYDINLTKRKGNIGIVTGMGLSWYNFRFDKDITIIDDEDTDMVMPKYLDQDWHIKKSKLTISYLTVPILLEWQPKIGHRRIYISGGVIGGLKLRAHTKIKYKLDGTHKKKNHDDFNTRPYKVDATFRIGMGDMSIFGTYGLVELFKNGKGPELTPYSIGLAFHIL